MALPVTISADWKNEGRVGVTSSALFILINLVAPQLTIGLPTRLVSFSDDFVLAGVAAPLVEEAFFRFLLLNSLLIVGLPVLLVVVMTAGLFSLFHYTAYGASLAAQNASFIGAFLFGVVVAFIAIRRKSFIIPMIIHFTFNTWLLIRLYT